MAHRILVIDDDPVVRAHVETLLQPHPYEVRGASGEVDGLSLLRAFTPHLVLLDISLENTTGFKLVDPIRAISKAPILMFTAAHSTEVEKDAKLLGIARVLPKPLIEKEFLAILSSCLSSQPSQT
jgi:DNA-binding response OmpR family regulator